MKKLVLVVAIIGCFVFARTRSESWQVRNITISGNRAITAPYLNSGLFINAQGSIINVTLPGQTSVNYTVMQQYQSVDFYPLNFVSGTVVTLNSSTTTNVQYIWFNNKE